MNTKIELVLRIILALGLLTFGLNKFFPFMPMEAPPECSFPDALFKTGYLIPLIALSEIVPGFLLLINKWKGFALVWLAPISINIVAFHLRYDVSTIGAAALVALLNALLIYANWNKFKGLFS
jgi:putative oxidoreductase